MGVDLNTNEASWDEIKSFEYKKEIGAMVYPTNEPIADFKTYVDTICASYPDIKIDIDAKEG